MVPDSTISEIKARLSIVDIVSEYLPLKKAGQTFLGLCPFHKEKTPSFNVHPVRQCFHCFGCHKGGDIFTFVAGVEGLSFPETLQKLASRAGVMLKQEHKTTRTPEATGNARVVEVLVWSAKYFHFLLVNRPEGKPVLEYLKKRGLSQKSIERFQLGVSPAGWSGLKDQMLRRGFPLPVLEEAGLITVKDGGQRSYDRFRGRLMFPILNKEGRPIGFGARKLNDQKEDEPKYLNSSDSTLFSKRKNLYGIFENSRGIRLRGEAIIVEGYMDVVGLWERGIDSALAVMGTALTEEHCQQIRMLTNRVVTVFDPDKAGEAAWKHSVHLFFEQGILARDVSLPGGQDPDDFVKDRGADAFYELADKAPRQATKWLKEIAARGGLSEKETAQVLGEIAPLLRATRKLPDRVTLWDDICMVLKVKPENLKEMSEALTTVPMSKAAPTPSRVPSSVARVESPAPLDPVEKAFLRSAMQYAEEFRGAEVFWVGIIREPRLLALLRAFHGSDAKSGITLLQSALSKCPPSDELGAILSEFLTGDAGFSKDSVLAWSEASSLLFRRRTEGQIQSLSAQARLAQRMGNEAEALELLSKIRDLRAQIAPLPAGPQGA